MYSHTGRPSIPPERLLKAMLLQVLYSIPSNVKLVEQIHFNVLVWDIEHSVKNQVLEKMLTCGGSGLR